VLIQPFAQGLVKTLLAERLQEVVHGVGLKRLYSVFVKGGRKDDGRRVFDEFEHFESIDLWHLDVEENEIGMELLNGLQTFEAVIAFLEHADIGI
jgi:hypothetical protein